MFTLLEIDDLSNCRQMDGIDQAVKSFRDSGYDGKINVRMLGDNLENKLGYVQNYGGANYVYSPYGMVNRNWIVPAVQDDFWYASGKQDYDPALSHARNGVIHGIKLNVFGLATRLYPAFLTPESAKALGIKVESIEPAKKACKEIYTFYQKLGGNPKSLEKAIQLGYNKPIFKLSVKSKDDSKSSFNGAFQIVAPLGGGEDLKEWFEAASGTNDEEVIKSGIILLAVIAKKANTAGVLANPYEKENSELEDAAKTNFVNPDNTAGIMADNDAEFKKLQDAADADAKKGVELDSTEKEFLENSNRIMSIENKQLWLAVGALALVGLYFGAKHLKWIK